MHGVAFGLFAMHSSALRKGQSSGGKKRSPIKLMTRALAVRLDDRHPSARRACGKVRRADEARLIVDKIENVFVVPCMIAHRDAVNSPIETGRSAMAAVMPRPPAAFSPLAIMISGIVLFF